jgi:hypothetical protein
VEPFGTKLVITTQKMPIPSKAQVTNSLKGLAINEDNYWGAILVCNKKHFFFSFLNFILRKDLIIPLLKDYEYKILHHKK